jgi:hypothetical protein
MALRARPLASTHSAFNLRAVTPSADADLPDGVCRAIYVNDDATVTVAVIAESDTAAVTMRVAGPGILTVAARAVRVSGTTATDIVAMY